MAREFTMDAKNSGLTGNLRCFFGAESRPKHALTIFVDHRKPSLALLIKMYADYSRGVVALHRFIGGILGIIRFAQLADAIIASVAVSMIEFFRRKGSVIVQPCESVGSKIEALSDHDLDVAIIEAASDLAGVSRVPSLRSVRSVAPAENSGLRIVIKDRADEFGAQTGLWSVCHGFGLAQLPLALNLK